MAERVVKSRRLGFTLVEVLVAVAVLAVVVGATVAAINPGGQLKKSRDARRRSDLNQYRLALENYSSAHATLYPHREARQDLQTNLCTDLASYLSACPGDPRDGTYYFETESVALCAAGTACATQYVLSVDLEAGDYWEVCSNGRVGETVCGSATDNGATCTVGTEAIGDCP